MERKKKNLGQGITEYAILLMVVGGMMVAILGTMGMSLRKTFCTVVNTMYQADHRDGEHQDGEHQGDGEHNNGEDHDGEGQHYDSRDGEHGDKDGFAICKKILSEDGHDGDGGHDGEHDGDGGHDGEHDGDGGHSMILPSAVWETRAFRGVPSYGYARS